MLSYERATLLVALLLFILAIALISNDIVANLDAELDCSTCTVCYSYEGQPDQICIEDTDLYVICGGMYDP